MLTTNSMVGAPFCQRKPLKQQEAILGMQIAATMTFGVLAGVTAFLTAGGAFVTRSNAPVSSFFKAMSMGLGAASSAAMISSYLKAQELCIRKIVK